MVVVVVVVAVLLRGRLEDDLSCKFNIQDH